MQHEIAILLSDLKALRLRDLPISSYSRKALARTLEATRYYLEIYNFSINNVLQKTAMSPAAMTLVDYGGGHGLLSVLAKRVGIGRVVYVDNNSDAIKTVGVLSQILGAGPDVILNGDAKSLKEWCNSTGVHPDALLGMDVIEHIYVLDDFFAALHEVSPQMNMLFTTASTPYNKRIVRRLHRVMQSDELGNARKVGFWQKRRDHVKSLYPDMSDRELDYWADNTRGLTYHDVQRAVEAQSPNLLLDEYNTCDPETGSWTERILPIDDYRHIIAPYGYKLTVRPGFYNEYRRGPKAILARHYNSVIDNAPIDEPSSFFQRRRMKKALKLAPFIFLIVNSD